MGLEVSLNGIRAGQRRVEAVAHNLAHPRVRGGSQLEAHMPPSKAGAGDSVDISEQAVELLEASHQVGVNAAALGRIADTEQSLLDILG